MSTYTVVFAPKETTQKQDAKKETFHPFRSLKNYQLMHYELARSKGVLTEFLACKTLTAARKMLFG